MEHNQHLNEILYLIDKYVNEDKINKSELDEIISHIQTISTNKTNIYSVKLNFAFRNKLPRLPIDFPQEYKNKFDKYFNKHPKLNNFFKFKSSLVDTKSDFVIRLIDYNGSFEIVYLYNNEAFLIDCQKDKLIKISDLDLDLYIKAFDKQIGLDLNNNLSHLTKGIENVNTKQITIPCKTNFDDADPVNYTQIVLIPAIIEDCKSIYNHKFTFIMCFESDSEIISNSGKVVVSKTYYDTFQLCPPGNC